MCVLWSLPHSGYTAYMRMQDLLGVQLLLTVIILMLCLWRGTLCCVRG